MKITNPYAISVLAITVLTGVLIIYPASGIAQKKKSERKGEFYFSWGYNTEWYTHSTVHVEQPELGNSYSLNRVRAHDHRGWDDGLFSRAISIPQYNYRIGYIFNKAKGLGFEINFDHTKYIISDQDVHVTGSMGNKGVDMNVAFNESNGFFYYLNNGANFLLFNLVKQWHLYESPNEKLKVDVLGKAGIGPVIPHVENSLFGQKNDPHFQVGGWNMGVEGTIKATFFNTVFLEYCNKLDYARYSHLRIYKGTVHQAFGTYEMILNLGVVLPVGKKLR